MMLRGGVKRQTLSLLPAPLPKANYKAQDDNGHHLAQGRNGAAARALHYDVDYNDYSKREKSLGDDRGLRRLQRQELPSWLYVIVCVTTITSTWKRKRDRLLWSLPQEYWHKEKGATTTQRQDRPQWLLPCRIDYRRGHLPRDQRHRWTMSSD